MVDLLKVLPRMIDSTLLGTDVKREQVEVICKQAIETHLELRFF